MKKTLFEAFCAVCAILVSVNVMAEDKKGSGYEYDHRGNKYYFKSVSTFDENGLRTAETRMWYDESDNLLAKSVDTYKFGLLTNRDFTKRVSEEEWVRGWSLVCRYDIMGNLTQETLKDENGAVLSDKLMAYSSTMKGYLCDYVVFNAETGNYVVRKSEVGEFTSVEYDEQKRVSSTMTMRLDQTKTKVEYDVTSYIYDEDGTQICETECDDAYGTRCLEKFYLKRNAGNIEDISEAYVWDTEADDWSMVSSLSEIYNSRKQKIEENNMYFDDGELIDFVKGEFSYNENGDTLSIVRKVLDMEDFLFKDLYAVSFNYDENGLLESRIVEEGYVELEKIQETIYSYSADGRIAGISENEYDGSNVPSKTQQMIYDYIDENNVIMTLYLSNTIPMTRRTYTKDANGNWTYYLKEDYEDGEWVGKDEMVRSFNENSQQTSLISSEYNTNLGVLANVVRSEMEYDEAGRNTITAYYYYNKSQLKGVLKFEELYDANGNLAEINEYEWDNDADEWFMSCTQLINWNDGLVELKAADAGTAVCGEYGRIVVKGASEGHMRVLTTAGVTLFEGKTATIAMKAGLYIVEIDGAAAKVVVR